MDFDLRHPPKNVSRGHALKGRPFLQEGIAVIWAAGKDSPVAECRIKYFQSLLRFCPERSMPKTCCPGADEFFDRRLASRELRKYRRRGPRRSSRKLIDALVSEGVEACTLLDIGGGVGAVQHALFEAGAASAVSVDASVEYMRAAQMEALRLGNRTHTSMYHGDFVDLASKVARADIVTLDRVLCCYEDATRLVAASAAKAKLLYGLVYPRGSPLSRLGIFAFNGLCWLSRKQFRTYYHRPSSIRNLLASLGFTEAYSTKTLIWLIQVYKR